MEQIIKKSLISWLAYIDKNKSDSCTGQAAQQFKLYNKFAKNEQGFDKDLEGLVHIALNYTQVESTAEDWKKLVVSDPLKLKCDPSYFNRVETLSNDGLIDVIRMITKSWENYILRDHNPLISGADLYRSSSSPDISDASTGKFISEVGVTGVFNSEFHIQNLFVDIPPFQYLSERFTPHKVLDIGCGSGAYLRLMSKLGGAEIFGVDGFQPSRSFLHPTEYLQHDLTQPLSLQSKYDLVMCLEVAEHLPPGFEKTLLDTLDRHASATIIFSAGEVGQPGVGHINCRPFEEWAYLLSERGWSPLVDETLFFRCISSFSWFRRNPVILQKNSVLPSAKSVLNQWDKLVQISKQKYNWYDQEAQIVSNIMDIDIPVPATVPQPLETTFIEF